jgi:hypothetical protein
MHKVVFDEHEVGEGARRFRSLLEQLDYSILDLLEVFTGIAARSKPSLEVG